MQITFEQAQQEFELGKTGEVAQSTIRWYMQRINTLGQFLGNVVLEEITITDLRRWRKDLMERDSRWASHPSKPEKAGKLSTWTIRGHVRAIRYFFNWLVEEGLLSDNPAKRLKLPPKPKEPPKAVTTDNLKKLLDVARDTNIRDYAIVSFLADTGCRLGGLVGLTLADLDLKEKCATVKEKGRGGERESRTVYFTKETTKALKAYLQQRPPTEEQQIFLGLRGPLTDNGVYQMLERLAKKAGVNGRSNPHAFRHGFARGSLKNGADLATVSQLLGHSSIQVTAEFYTRWADSELAERHHEFSWLKSAHQDEQSEEE